MRKTLLELHVVELVCYTYSLIDSTLLAAGDCEYVSYLLLADAANAKIAATPRELARIMEMDERELVVAGDFWEREGLLTRTRSPLDGRCVGYFPTLMGFKHAEALNDLLFAAFKSYWRCDDDTVRSFIEAIKPFQRKDPAAWSAKTGWHMPLQFLCALRSLRDEYCTFSHSNVLTFSEMRILLAVDRYGSVPNNPLFQFHNQFSLTDFNSVLSLEKEKKLLMRQGDVFILSERGKAKIAALFSQCDMPTRNKSNADSSIASKLVELCNRITEEAIRETGG